MAYAAFYRYLFLLALSLGLSVTFAQNLTTRRHTFCRGAITRAQPGCISAFLTRPAIKTRVALYKLANAKVYAAGQTEGDAAETLYDAAVTAAKEAVQLVPDDLEAHMALVRAWGQAGAV